MSTTTNNSSPANQIVRLNIGGKRFYTTYETLTRFSENDQSFFKALLSEKIGVLRDENGFVFIDRNGKLFEPILDYLRTGNWSWPESVDPKRLLEEAEFYGILVQKSLSNEAIEEMKKQVEEDEVDDILTKYDKEVEELKEIIFNSFTNAIKQKRAIRTPWLVDSKQFEKYHQSYFVSQEDHEEVLQIKECCYKALQQRGLVRAFINHLRTKYNLDVREQHMEGFGYRFLWYQDYDRSG